MLSPQFLGAFTKWILKGCKTNLLKDELNDENPWSNISGAIKTTSL